MIRGGNPPAKNETVSNRMRHVRREGTAAELAVRSCLHRLGLRFRVHINPVPQSRAKPDIVFKKSRVAVYVDGCFWHACPDHASWPKTNSEWWREKIQANVERDKRHTAELISAGWTVIRFWEHEQPSVVADKIHSVIRQRMTT